MGLFNRRRKQAAVPQHQALPDPGSQVRTTLDDAPSLSEAIRSPSKANAMRPGIGLLKFIPIGKLIDSLMGILRDPNGKISSKRAGAGALVVAGISFLGNGQRVEGIICLVAAIGLFALTKYDHTP